MALPGVGTGVNLAIRHCWGCYRELKHMIFIDPAQTYIALTAGPLRYN